MPWALSSKPAAGAASAPSGTQVVYIASQDAADVYELYRNTIPAQLNPGVPVLLLDD